MSTERLISGAVSSHAELETVDRIFEELPTANIVSVSRPDASDISPLLLWYTIELQYKEFKWQLLKKASEVICLHFAMKKRAIIEEFHGKHEQVRDWLQNLGLVDNTTVMLDEDEIDVGAVLICNEDSVKSRYVPSKAALPIICPAIGRQQTVSEKAKAAMQGYLSHFLGNLDIINSREVCKFLEVSRLSFLQKYGTKMKEGYVMVKHLPMFSEDDACSGCCLCHFSGCCGNNWKKVWLVLKHGFLAFLENHFETKLLDIIVFDVLVTSDAKGDNEVNLSKVLKERNPLRHAFQVSCGNRVIKLRTTSRAKAQDWVSAINAVGPKHSEGWCHPHRFNSFAPTRGLVEDGSSAQWFIDGKAAFEAIASSIEGAKSEIYMTGWWLCPDLYLRRPFHDQRSSRLDVLLEAKAKEGVQKGVCDPGKDYYNPSFMMITPLMAAAHSFDTVNPNPISSLLSSSPRSASFYKPPFSLNHPTPNSSGSHYFTTRTHSHHNSSPSLSRRLIIPAVSGIWDALTSANSARDVVRRGMLLFRQGDVLGSVVEFDKAIQLDPRQRAYLWQRGLSLYYLNRFEDGAEQFRLDVAQNPNDTEESIWCFLCEAQLYGVDEARKRFLEVGTDSRRVMREAYYMFRDGGDPEKLVAAFSGGRESEYFYASLYAGLYYESQNISEEAKLHLIAACKSSYGSSSGDYMASLAKVHCDCRNWSLD